MCMHVVYNVYVHYKKLEFQVKLVMSCDDQKRILRSCHSDPTSGHFGESENGNVDQGRSRRNRK